MTTRAAKVIKQFEENGGATIHTELLKLGLNDVTESWAKKSGIEVKYEANHKHRQLHQIFLKHGWMLTFNGEVAKGLKQASYEHQAFGGGNAVLHFKGNKVYYMTFDYRRDYRD